MNCFAPRSAVTLLVILISMLLINCNNSTEEKSKTVDTTIFGSDNPNPPVDTSIVNKADSSKR